MNVYYHPANNLFGINSRSDLVIFHYEHHKFTFVDNIAEADIIPLMCHPHQTDDHIKLLQELNVTGSHLIVLLDVFHSGDDVHTLDQQRTIDIYKNKGFNAVLIHCDHNVNTTYLIHYDHMWNRQKVYFTDYDNYDLASRHWTFKATKKMFELPKIEEHKSLIKKFLIPNKTYKHNFLSDLTGVDESHTFRSKARVVLEKAVLEYDCYYSNPNNYLFLEPQEFSQDIIDDHHFFNMGMGFSPIANKYYDTSSISVYIETLVSSKSKQGLITEKTFNPLIKGHFIIPFSYSGFIKDLREIYGFKFPDWIDYRYDTIEDDQDRFHEFMKSFSKVRLLSLTQLEEKRYNDIDILKHNRQIFYDRQYCSLYDSLINSINIIYRKK